MKKKLSYFKQKYLDFFNICYPPMGSLKKIRQFGPAVWPAIYSYFFNLNMFFLFFSLCYKQGSQGFHKECQPIGVDDWPAIANIYIQGVPGVARCKLFFACAVCQLTCLCFDNSPLVYISFWCFCKQIFPKFISSGNM